MRLVDADIATDAISNMREEPEYQHVGEDWKIGLMHAEDMLDEQPTVDAIPTDWLTAKISEHNNDGFAWMFEAVRDEWRRERGEALRDAPTVEERKKGRWVVYKAPDKYHCSLVKCPFCGEDMIAEAEEYNFCPNCGAKMERDEEWQGKE